MARLLPKLSHPGLLLAILTSCGGGGAETPESRMARADEAKAAQDYQQALELYDGLIDWNGEETVAPATRFKASIESVKCLIAASRSEEGVERYSSMFGQYPELEADRAYKHALALLRALDDANADADFSIALLDVAKKRYPEQQAGFTEWGEKLLTQNLDDEQMAKMRTLGYLTLPKKPKKK